LISVSPLEGAFQLINNNCTISYFKRLLLALLKEQTTVVGQSKKHDSASIASNSLHKQIAIRIRQIYLFFVEAKQNHLHYNEETSHTNHNET
jgi:hypothetical protein